MKNILFKNYQSLLSLCFILGLVSSSLMAGDQGQVKIELSHFMQLINQKEANEKRLQSEEENQVANIAAFTSITQKVLVKENYALIETEAELLFQGEDYEPASLELSGFAEEIRFEGDAELIIETDDEFLNLLASKPGAYKLYLKEKLPFLEMETGYEIVLAALPSPVSRIDLSLPEDLHWFSYVPLVNESTSDQMRHLTFAPNENNESTIEISRKKIINRDVLTRIEAVTLLQVLDLDVQRHDILFYSVERGALNTFKVEVPQGLVIDEVFTDEGVAKTRTRDGMLIVERKNRLTNTGYMVLSSNLGNATSIQLDAIKTPNKINAHYLVTSPTIPSEIIPGKGWLRMDLADIPLDITNLAKGLDLSSVWRASNQAEPQVTVKRYPIQKVIPQLISSRKTHSIWTREGVLVNKERIQLAKHNGIFTYQPPAGSQFWSAKVDEQQVRPILRNGSYHMPLPARANTLVEVITFQEVGFKHDEITFPLAQLNASVMLHQWEVFLPKGKRYKLVKSQLEQVDQLTAIQGDEHQYYETVGDAMNNSNSNAPLQVLVTHGSRPIHGAAVKLYNHSFDKTLYTNENGITDFKDIPSGIYNIETTKSGFHIHTQGKIVVAHDQQRFITNDLTPIDENRDPWSVENIVPEVQVDRVNKNTSNFAAKGKDGEFATWKLSTGVKPLPINLPKDGKAIYLRSIHPPKDLAVTIKQK